MVKALDFMKVFDYFGVDVSMRNKIGESKSRSLLGAVFSFILFTVLLTYFIGYINMINTLKYESLLIDRLQLSQQTNNVTLVTDWYTLLSLNVSFSDVKSKYSNQDTLFNSGIGFAFLNRTSKKFIPIDLTKFNIMVYNKLDEVLYPLYFETCIDFKGLSTNDFSTFNLNDAYCIRSNITLNSTSSLVIKLNKCMNNTYFGISSHNHPDYLEKMLYLPDLLFPNVVIDVCKGVDDEYNLSTNCLSDITRNYNYFYLDKKSIYSKDLITLMTNLKNTIKKLSYPIDVNSQNLITSTERSITDLVSQFTSDPNTVNPNFIAFRKLEARKYSILYSLLRNFNKTTISANDINSLSFLSKTDILSNPFLSAEEINYFYNIFSPDTIQVNKNDLEESLIVCDSDPSITSFISDLQLVYISSFSRMDKFTLKDDLFVNYFPFSPEFFKNITTSVELNDLRTQNSYLPNSLSSFTSNYFVSQGKFDFYINALDESTNEVKYKSIVKIYLENQGEPIKIYNKNDEDGLNYINSLLPKIKKELELIINEEN